MKEQKDILLSHGGGGKHSNDLIEKTIFPFFANKYLNEKHDGAVFNINETRFAFTTDSYVVQPLFFPGGDIGKLAINGTVNDLAMCGAEPLFISLAFIIEEGFSMDELEKILSSLSQAADQAGVQIVTGDTKVVQKGKGDKIFINTSGIGKVFDEANISPQNCKSGDVIILSGTIGDHGLAVLSARENLDFETTIKSDTAPLNKMVKEIFSVSNNIKVMRDPTRGGLASALNELAASSNCGIEIVQSKIPVNDAVRNYCEILGFDPLYIANEGKMIAVVPEEDSEKILTIVKQNKFGKDAAIIGKFTATHAGVVVLKTEFGTSRVVDMITGEQLPRIC